MSATPAGRHALLVDLENLCHLERTPGLRVPSPRAGSDDSEPGHVQRTFKAPHHVTAVDNDTHVPVWETPERCSALLRRAAELAGPFDYAVMTGHGSVLARVAFESTFAGWCKRAVETEPDAADHQLLATAWYLAGHGYDRFTIVSGDHCFAGFAAAQTCTVIARTHKSLAPSLAAAAARYYLMTVERDRAGQPGLPVVHAGHGPTLHPAL